MYMCLCVDSYTGVQVAAEARWIRAMGAGVTGKCELPAKGAGNWTSALCKGTTCSMFLTVEPHLSRSWFY